MKKLLWFLSVTLLPCSCSSKKQTINLLVDRVDNLSVGASVTMKGVRIGYVDHLSLQNDSVLVEMKINRNISIPVTSVVLVQASLMGISSVVIQPAENLAAVQKDTLRGSYQERSIMNEFISDTITAKKAKESVQKIVEGIRELSALANDSVSQ